MLSNEKKIQHLWSRAAFGLEAGAYDSAVKKSVSENVDQLFQSSKNYSDLNVIEPFNTYNDKRKDLSKEDKKLLKMEQRSKLGLLNVSWLMRLGNDEGQFRERMTFFWHNHFACRGIFPNSLQKLNNVMRTHALEHFKNLLLEVSKTPAMLMFLNNMQNKKEHPNENFARELMELFTIGRGNYTENDVKAAARAFTGWSFDIVSGDFVFRAKQHDFDEKTFMGKTGNFNGEDIINIILETKETARFIVKKIYREFVNDVIDENRVNALAESYFNSGYHTGKLMREIFSSDWFYDEKNVGTKIKSPVDLIVGLNRTFKIEYQKPEVLMHVQKALGQQLFFPPNVSGWPGGKNWIDSSSLMLRLRLPSIFLNDGIVDFDTKEDDDLNETMMNERMYSETKKKVRENIKAHADWNYFLTTLPANVSREELANRLLLPTFSKQAALNVETTSTEDVKTIVLELLSLPEYQMG